MTINFATDFTRYPGGRYRDDGQYPGERFREDFLVPALKTGERVTVDLDNVMGFGSGFLEEAFGGLIRLDSVEPSAVITNLEIIGADENIRQRIHSYIKDALVRKLIALLPKMHVIDIHVLLDLATMSLRQASTTPDCESEFQHVSQSMLNGMRKERSNSQSNRQSDAEIGKLVRDMARVIETGDEGEDIDDSAKAHAASLILASVCHRINGKLNSTILLGVTYNDVPLGDWKITIERLSPAEEPAAELAEETVTA